MNLEFLWDEFPYKLVTNTVSVRVTENINLLKNQLQ